MKGISDLFIFRPVMTTLVMLGILIFGITAYRKLPVSNLPSVDFPTIQVSADLPGANPDTMASAVATPLEKQFSTIAGIDSMTSTSVIGKTSITLQFNLSRDLDAAAQDVQAAISGVLGKLPDDMPNPPTFRKVNPADEPVLLVALTSPTLPLSDLDEYGETLMAQQISMISGVAQVMVYGSQKYAVRIQLDPNKLANKNIGIDQVAQAVSNANVNLPTGTLYGPDMAFTVQANGQIRKAKEYSNLIVAYRNGGPVRLKDMGTVIDSVENNKTAAWYVNSQSSRRAIVLAIQRQPGTNTVEVTRDVRNLLTKLTGQLPASVSLNILFDQSESIRKSVNDVKITLLLTLFLVIAVIFIFLRNLSATVIPSLALPMSIIGTFTVMYFLNYSLDNLSLMALTLCVGFVVDDAIVMLENIVRHMEMGEVPFKAAVNGAREIGFTILSMTFSLAAVFIPVLFMGGIIGRLFKEFAVTIGVAILISGFISLTLTPMLCSRFLRPPEEKNHGRFYNAFERFFQELLDVYKTGLHWSLAHQKLIMIFSAMVLVATGFLFVKIPKGFIPSEDIGQMSGSTQAIQGISFEAMVRHQQAAAAIIQQDPDVAAIMSRAGSGGNSSGNSGAFRLTLKPRTERKDSVDEIISRLREKLAQIPGIRVFLQNPPPISIGGRQSKSQYQLTLQGANTAELYQYASKLEEKMRQLPGLTDINSDLEMKNLQADAQINRDKAAAMGVSMEQIENTLYYAYGSRQISTIYAPNNTYNVIMEVQPGFQQKPADLSMLYVRSDAGNLVPLSAVAGISTSLGPLSINHTGQQISVTLSFNLKQNYPLGQAVNEINKLAASVLPAGITTNFQGTAQAFQDSMQGLGLLLVMAFLVIYMVLGILYESFIHPITILSALPFAGFGALITLMVFRVDLSIYAFVGIIMLIGLVKKNGIIMIDFAIEAQRSGSMDPEEAIFEACVVRFRPIMMTTMAALMGTLPIALGLGAGAESRRPLGLAVVGGLLFSQFLTLFVTPVFYLYMERLRKMVGNWSARHHYARSTIDL
ncbi:MAG: efflux RND transporter permease subunit [Desulfobacteraceae bacterium]|nr:efflux RND transporter permease subunit [Desulfobacteraceae bacterium]